MSESDPTDKDNAEVDQCPNCGYEVTSRYRENGVIAGCKNDDCRVVGFRPWIDEEDIPYVQ